MKPVLGTSCLETVNCTVLHLLQELVVQSGAMMYMLQLD